jgi:DNA polymerase-4
MALQFRDILHVDVDAFFASVEQALDPALAGKPVIVAGDPDGRSVVASASYEARRYGVRSAMPVAQARRLCPQGLFVTGHFDAYGEFSERIGNILRRFAPVVQAVSLDDFYLDLTGCRRLHGPLLPAAERMKFDVRAETDLSVTIGIAANKLVAKIASDLARPNGILEVGRGTEAAFLRNLPVETLPGVGPGMAEALRRFNLATVGDIARLPEELLQKTFGVAGLALWERARGCDDSPVVAEAGRPKSVSREHTFAEDTMDHEQVRSMLYYLIEHAARSLREECLLARRVTVKVRYSDFRTVTAARTLCAPTDEDRLLYDAAAEKLSRLVERRMRTRLVGVALSGLLPSGGTQGDLFAGARAQRRRRFYRALDRLRGRFGFDIAVVGPSLNLIGNDGDG